ncbi:probable protein phosphatase 2C 34 [Nicotiana tomentosiformis]|uniref:probable protein phosphatase 2C 34 n=1 Tax=Nicotiana tomentosiformis TaxID=4098 RepID=UPI00051C59DA|nr:probable protein phosphatase 2C 34 [Nicotiana tomentosiformis]XP_018625287.1 probable protein phosphatase 2C 34 [Nicotiana tomentosiformis]
MVQFSSVFNGFKKSLAIKNGRKSGHDFGREVANTLAKEAKKNELMLTSSGCVACGSKNSVSFFSKGGKKGINQDRFIVWEDFGCQDDMIFCGVFDGHGPWGHLVAKRVRKLMPPALLHNWQKRVVNYIDGDGIGIDRSCFQFDIWKQSYFETCSTIDQELEHYADSFYSGTTALTLVRQGDLLVVANVGDSRAVLATTDDDGRLGPVQLTVDLKPNLPRESERIMQSRGRVLSCDDEPGVYRVWMPNRGTIEGPGLAISRAFGDYYLKDFGLISEPELTSRSITQRDQFAILATDGVWDVLSNQEAVEIVSSTPEREDAAKRLVESAICAWKRKRRGIPMDDISAICLFFHSIPPSKQEDCLKEKFEKKLK